MTHLLVADDDDTVRATLRRAFSSRGYEVTAVGDGVEALEALTRHDIDLVVTDINMPTMDGIELVRRLVERQPGLKVIAISGGGLLPKDELLTDARLLGAVEVLEKPFDVGVLLDRVDRVLERA